MDLSQIIAEMDNQMSDEDTKMLVSIFGKMSSKVKEATDVSKQFSKFIESNNEVIGLLKELVVLQKQRMAENIKTQKNTEKSNELLNEIRLRPDIEIPEQVKVSNFPKFEFPKIEIPKPVSAKEIATELAKSLAPLFKDIYKKLDKEPAIIDTPKTSAVNIKHPKIKWIIDSTKNGNLLGAVDGSNTIFYTSRSPVRNSEEIRLNMGLPLSEGIDYSISGNMITFIVPPQVGMQIQIKYQA